jgi:hypothetical protein
MSRRRDRRRNRTVQRPTGAKAAAPPAAIVREATRVERLAYTRTQAAQALGVSRSTFDRRVLPLIETIEMPWGTKLIPVDEFERLTAERRRPPRDRPSPTKRGRPSTLSRDVVDQIRAERASGRTLRQIATDLNNRGVATAHGGSQWWPSSVQAVLRRSAA